MQDLTITQIRDQVESLPETCFTDVCRKIAAFDAMIKPTQDEIKKAQDNQWGRYFHYVAKALTPEYEKRAEHGEHFVDVIVEVYNKMFNDMLLTLSQSGVTITVGNKGTISEPRRLGQYDLNIRRVLKLDVDGELLKTDDDGEFINGKKGGVEKLGKRLADAAEKAETEARMKRLMDTGKLQQIHGAKPTGDAAAPAPAQAPAPEVTVNPDLTPEQQEAFTNLMRMAVLLNQQERKASSGVVIKGTDKVTEQLNKASNAFRNLLSDTFHINLEKALAKAAA